MADSLTAFAAELYGTNPSDLRPLRGGHVTRVYEFCRGGIPTVMRVTPPDGELDVRGTRAILEWMDFLARNGGPAVRPVRSQRGNLVEQDSAGSIITAVEKASGVLAEELPAEQWGDGLFHSLGRAVGRMHAIARRYIPADESLRRPQWDAAGNCFNPMPPLDDSQVVVRSIREQVARRIRTLPRDEESYGLIHADLHFANLFVDIQNDVIAAFDFDDCCYGWYVMDIAMSLFDILALYTGPDREAFAVRFLRPYLQGYRAESPLSAFWLRQIPDFLTLLEIGVYAQLCGGWNPDDPWSARFMPGRRERIVAGVPYVDVDFAAIDKAAKGGCHTL